MRMFGTFLKPWPQPEQDAWMHRMFRVYGLPILIGIGLFAMLGPEKGRTVDSPIQAMALIGVPLAVAWIAHVKSGRWRL